MAPKNMSTVTVSRRLVSCDYCGKEYEQRNLKEHTKRVNPGGAHQEMLDKGQWIFGFTTEPKPKTPRTQDFKSYVLCLMSYVLCLMSYALCLMSYVLCLVSYVLCLMSYVLSLMSYVLGLMSYILYLIF